MTTIYRYNVLRKAVGPLDYDTATHEEDLSGNDKLTLVTRENVQKGEFLMWQDNTGRWHEHLVDAVSRVHQGGKARTSVTCSNSLNELYGRMALGTVIEGNVKTILENLVVGTCWEVGATSSTGRFGRIRKLEVWHRNVRECIADLVTLCGGELITTILVDGSGNVTRRVRIMAEYSNDTANRMFTYGRNMENVRREVSSDMVYTKVVGYGAKIEETAISAELERLQGIDTSGMEEDDKKAHQERVEELREALQKVRDDDYAPRLRVVSTSSAELKERYGVRRADGTMGHSVLVYNDAACTDANFLKRQTDKLMEEYQRPSITYEFDLAQVSDEWRSMQLGRYVIVKDDGFDPAIEMRVRVTRITRKLRGKMSCRVTVGGRRRNVMVEQFKANEKTTRQNTGNSTKVASRTSTNTGGGSSYTSGVSGGVRGGEGIIHTLDGVRITSGTIAFTTVAGSDNSQDGGDWGSGGTYGDASWGES